MAEIQLHEGFETGRHYPLVRERSVLGRHPDCDIVLEAGAVSRQHAVITRESNDYIIEDLQSRNGTLVNGEPAGNHHKLKTGDRIQICELIFTFIGDEAENSDRLLHTGDSTLALLLDDDSQPSSTIVSKLDVSTSQSGVRLSANPQVKLEAMLEITKNLSTALKMEDILPKVLDSLFKLFVQADRGFIALKDPESGKLVPKAARYRRHDSDETIRISRAIVNRVMDLKEAILSADAATDSRFEMSQSVADFRIRSMMCAPLVDSDGISQGVIQIDTLDQRSRFRENDLDVLLSVAAQASFAVENATLHDTAMRQRAFQRDLELAHKVQHGLLPLSPPNIEGYEFFDFYEPAYMVGGDFYDYVRLKDDRWAIVLADVSGKGISAALVMAKLAADVRYCLASEFCPADTLNRINENFLHSGWEDRFVTLVMVVLDSQKNEAVIANAGHMPPLLRPASGKVGELAAGIVGVPLGVDVGIPYEQSKIQIQPGDTIVAYTDGISEAMNSEGDLYGTQRIKEQLSHSCDSITQTGQGILDDVNRFVKDYRQSDDICLTCLRRCS